MSAGPIRIQCSGRGVPLFGWELREKSSGTIDEPFEVEGVEVRWRPGPETKDLFGPGPIGDLLLWLSGGVSYDVLARVVKRVWAAARKTEVRLRVGAREPSTEEELLSVLLEAQGSDEDDNGAS